MTHIPRRRRTLTEAFYSFPSELLIAVARLALAGFGALAVYIDPTQPARYSDITNAIILIYAIFAAAIVAISLVATLRANWVAHVIDIAIISALIYFTDGPTSLFFVFFTYVLVVATLRWGWSGTWGTTTALVVILVGIGYADIMIAQEGRAEWALSHLIIRATYLLVVGAMLAYLAALRSSDRARLSKLASWPHENTEAGQYPPIAGSLRHAAEVIGAGDVLVLWDDGEEPGFQLAHWTGERCEFHHWHEADLVPINPDLKDITFLTRNAGTKNVVLHGGRRSLRTPLLAPKLAEVFNIGSFSCAPFDTQHTRGWILLLDPPPLFEGLLSLSDIVAARIGAELEHFYLRAENAEAAVAQERVRLARDIHDGVLQDLTAANLQLRSVASQLSPDSAERVAALAGLLTERQQVIRNFVETMNPKRLPSEYEFEEELAPQFEAFARGLGEQWSCTIETEVFPQGLRVLPSLAVELCLMASEAVANAARHGQARHITVTVFRTSDDLSMYIHDDGPELRAVLHAVPFSLGERVKDLGGSVSLADSQTGFTLKIALPRP